MGLLLANSSSTEPTTVGSLALALAERRETRPAGLELAPPAELVERSDLDLVLAPCREVAGAHAETGGRARDLAWQKSIFARACWELSRSAGWSGGMQAAVDAVCARPAPQWPLLLTGGKGGGDQRSYGNVCRWIRSLGQDRAGVPAWSAWGRLAKRHGGGRTMELDEEFAERFFRLWLSQRTAGIKSVWRALAVEFRRAGQAGRIPSYDTMAAYVRDKADAAVVQRYRGRPGTWTDEMVGYISRYCNCQVGDVAFSDHRIMDIWVRTVNEAGEWVAVRPYFTAWLDARSMYLTAATIYADRAPNHETILEAFLLHVRRMHNRAPMIVYTDNGKDFLKLGFGTAVRLRTKRGEGWMSDREGTPYEYSILQALGVEIRRAKPYNGREKPIERIFRDHATDWERLQVGYCGNKPQNRPDDRLTWQGDVMRLPTVGQAMESFNQWLESTGQKHMREEGKTRAEMWEGADLSHLRQFEEQDLFFRMLLPHRTTPLVSRTPMGPGVKFGGWMYGHADLARHWGEPVMVKTYWQSPKTKVQIPSRNRGLVWAEVPAYVFVYTPDDRLICMAPACRQHGMIAEGEDLESLGTDMHAIHAVAARAKETFRELTGRERVSDPQVVLRQIAGGATGGGVVERSELAGGRRRLPGGGRADAGEGQAPCRETAGDWSDGLTGTAADGASACSELDRLLREANREIW